MGTKEISRTDFFAFFQRFHDKTFKNPRIHKSAFRKTGLIPLDLQQVLLKLKEYQALQRPKTPPPLIERSSPPLPSSLPRFTTPPPLDQTQFQTPLTIRTRKLGVEYIKQRYNDSLEQGTPITPSVIHIAKKIEKATETSMLSRALSKHRLQDLAIVEAARKKRKDSSGKVVQKYGKIRFTMHVCRFRPRRRIRRRQSICVLRRRRRFGAKII